MIYTDSEVHIPCSHFPTRFVYTNLSTFIYNSLNSRACDPLKTKWKIFFRENHPIPPASSHPFTYFQSNFGLFLICGPGTFVTKTTTNLSAQLEKTNPPVRYHVTLFDQLKNHTVIQACNRRNHETFQLTDIFFFTSQYPRDYTRFFHNYRYLNFLLS